MNTCTLKHVLQTHCPEPRDLETVYMVKVVDIVGDIIRSSRMQNVKREHDIV